MSRPGVPDLTVPSTNLLFFSGPLLIKFFRTCQPVDNQIPERFSALDQVTGLVTRLRLSGLVTRAMQQTASLLTLESTYLNARSHEHVMIWNAIGHEAPVSDMAKAVSRLKVPL